MPKKEFVMVEKEMIYKAINTLKSIDVRGYESMNSLVGLVIFFQNIASSQTIDLGGETEKVSTKEG